MGGGSCCVSDSGPNLVKGLGSELQLLHLPPTLSCHCLPSSAGPLQPRAHARSAPCPTIHQWQQLWSWLWGWGGASSVRGRGCGRGRQMPRAETVESRGSGGVGRKHGQMWGGRYKGVQAGWWQGPGCTETGGSRQQGGKLWGGQAAGIRPLNPHHLPHCSTWKEGVGGEFRMTLQ